MQKSLLAVSFAAWAWGGSKSEIAGTADLQQPDCDFSLELVILQDTSHSFQNDIPNLKLQLPELLENIKVAYPESRFAYYSFVDKPVEPFGWPSDYCWKEMSPFTDDTADIERGIEALAPGGGYDWPEALLPAMQHAALSPDLGWKVSMETESGRPIARVILSITDAPYHVAGHGLPVGLYINNGDSHLDCANEDYPSVDQVKEAIDENRIFAGFLVANDPRVPVDVIQVYRELAETLHGPDGIAVADITEDAGHLADGIRHILVKLNSHICPESNEDTTQPPRADILPAEQPCLFTYEIAFQMDLSDSYSFELTLARMKSDEFFSQMQYFHPGTIGAAVSHTDKPIPQFGFGVSLDYCHWLHQSMTDNPIVLEEAFSGMSTRSGWDWEEAQIESGMHTVLSEHTGWSNLPVKMVQSVEKTVKRVLIVMTDSGYHKAGDGHLAGLPPNNGDHILSCLKEDYPSEDQFISAMKATDTAVVFMVPLGISPPHLDPYDIYYDLSEKLKDSGVASDVVGLSADPFSMTHHVSALLGTEECLVKPFLDNERKLLDMPTRPPRAVENPRRLRSAAAPEFPIQRAFEFFDDEIPCPP